MPVLLSSPVGDSGSGAARRSLGLLGLFGRLGAGDLSGDESELSLL